MIITSPVPFSCACFLIMQTFKIMNPATMNRPSPPPIKAYLISGGEKTTGGHRLTRCNVTAMTEQNVKSGTRRLMFTTPDMLNGTRIKRRVREDVWFHNVFTPRKIKVSVMVSCCFPLIELHHQCLQFESWTLRNHKGGYCWSVWANSHTDEFVGRTDKDNSVLPHP